MNTPIITLLLLTAAVFALSCRSDEPVAPIVPIVSPHDAAENTRDDPTGNPTRDVHTTNEGCATTSADNTLYDFAPQAARSEARAQAYELAFNALSRARQNSPVSERTPTRSQHQIPINSASSRQLQRLPRIGPALAQRIINARPFHSTRALLNVQGIGPTTLEQIEHLIEIDHALYDDTIDRHNSALHVEHAGQ